MKKFFAIVLTVAMMLSLVSFSSAEGFSGEIKIWVAEAVVDFTNEQVAAFKEAHPEYANMTVKVEPQGEGDAATKVITDVESAADIFGFAQDQLGRLVQAGALEVVEEENAKAVEAENDAGSVGAVKMGDVMYAYPMTSDNGYFLYYDKSVVTDPTDLDKILADCEAAGKNFYFQVNSGWYQVAFFFAHGATISYETDSEGAYTKLNTNYASDEGVAALKSMIKMAKSPAYQNGSSLSTATNCAAIVDGVWDSNAAKELFGDNYAATKLPMADGVQLSGFGGFKMLGVKPQTDDAKLAACDALAAFLTSEEVQIARYKAVGWGPSNLNAQKDESVQADVALAALGEQLAFTVPQGQYPNGFWSATEGLGDDILAKKLDDADDAALLEVLNTLIANCEAAMSE
jgi:arabinogalactan oligomer/maltooligosaccharide transport system substrate-binding protein